MSRPPSNGNVNWMEYHKLALEEQQQHAKDIEALRQQYRDDIDKLSKRVDQLQNELVMVKTKEITDLKVGMGDLRNKFKIVSAIAASIQAAIIAVVGWLLKK